MRARIAELAWPAGGFALFALLHYSLCYHPGLVRMDDFGFLQSLAETIVRGRPYTHDSQTPYGATLSVLGALAYAATGDFPRAAWGLQSLFALALYLLGYLAFRARLPGRAAAALALLAATQPILWYKASEYTGNVFALAFSIAALCAWRRGRRAAFFLCAFLAYANRQNALGLMALPAWEALHPRGTRRPSALAGLAAFAAACLALHALMNPTISRAHDLSLLGGGAFAPMRGIAVSLCLGAALISALALAGGENALANLRANLRAPWAPAASLLFLAFYLPSLRLYPAAGAYVEFHTPGLDGLDKGGALQAALALGVPVLLWLLDWRRLSPMRPGSALFLAYAVLTGMRGEVYDFYLLELAMAAIYVVFSGGGPWAVPAWAELLALPVFAAHLAWGYAYAIRADKEAFAIRAYERLEREGRVTPDRMSDAPWGYAGWKLYDHFARTAVPGGEYFLCYLLRDQVIAETALPWRAGFRRGPLPPGAVLLDTGRVSVGFFRVAYRVADWGGKGESPMPWCYRPLDRERYLQKPLPLDAREWSEYLDRLRKARPPG